MLIVERWMSRIMAEEVTFSTWLWRRIMLIFIFILSTDQVIADAPLQIDREVLLQLKAFFQENNRVNQGQYAQWGTEHSPCSWSGITCNYGNSRVIGIDISSSGISGRIFGNFSALSELSVLDLSKNTIEGPIPSDLNHCKNLRFLNISSNILTGELNLNGLSKLEILDVAGNRLHGGIKSSFPTICSQLIAANVSSNSLIGGILNHFDQCWKLQVLELSANQFTGPIWPGFVRLREFSVSENRLSGELFPSLFSKNCSLQVLDLSVNDFHGEIPKEVSYCNALTSLNLWGNRFGGKIPPEIGNLSSLEVFNIGNNGISRDIPEELLNCRNLSYLNMDRNEFGGDIQEIFGRFAQVEILALGGNSYKGGIISSGILKLPKVLFFDLSYNQFSSQLPVEISKMASLEFLILAKNHFTGSIPPQFGELSKLKALDLSYNNLTGTIPSTIGNMTSVVWLMLAENKLTGAIPREIGNCSSLLWLNLADNRFIGKIPVELTRIGRIPNLTFSSRSLLSPFRDCRVTTRWIPANYAPFSFVYSRTLSKGCSSLRSQVFAGAGRFPVFGGASDVRKHAVSGYLQLTGNRFSGELPQEIGDMQNISLLLIGFNHFIGRLPPAIGRLRLVILNVSNNDFSGPIPWELGDVTSLQNLDLSRNNFSGGFPSSLGKLNQLSKFNVSYNPSISGVIPSTGQLTTFDDDSFLGDPKLIRRRGNLANKGKTPEEAKWHARSKSSPRVYLTFVASALAFLVFGTLSFIIFTILANPSIRARLLGIFRNMQPAFVGGRSGQRSIQL